MLSEKINLYENRDDITLTSYLIGSSQEMLGGKKRPAVLICPGGAYLSCSDREGEPVALRFAAMGYHAFVLRYSTYLGNQPGFPDLDEPLEINPNNIHPAPIRDIAKAILTIREYADEWLVDQEKIVLCGFSAGAHNCAMYAVYWDQPEINDYFDKDATVFRPEAVILGYGLSDYMLMKKLSMIPDHQKLFEASNSVFLGNKNPSEDILKKVSPALLVNERTPPMFLWATAEDELVPVQHTLKMATSLADHHIPFELHIYEEGKHGLSLATQASAYAKSQVNKRAACWITEAEEWLEKRFALPLAEKTQWE